MHCNGKYLGLDYFESAEYYCLWCSVNADIVRCSVRGSAQCQQSDKVGELSSVTATALNDDIPPSLPLPHLPSTQYNQLNNFGTLFPSGLTLFSLTKLQIANPTHSMQSLQI